METLGEFWFFRLVGRVIQHALFEVTFSIAVHAGFVLILAIFQVFHTIQLVIQGPERPDGGLAKDATDEEYGEKCTH